MPAVRYAIHLFLAVSGALALSATAAEGDAEAGKAKSAPCAVCHGVDGNSTIPINPKLAGQHEEALLAAMLAYKEGRREHPLMEASMQPLSEEDLRDLAAYYAGQPCD